MKHCDKDNLAVDDFQLEQEVDGVSARDERNKEDMYKALKRDERTISEMRSVAMAAIDLLEGGRKAEAITMLKACALFNKG